MRGRRRAGRFRGVLDRRPRPAAHGISRGDGHGPHDDQCVEALKLSVRQAEENYRIMQNRYLNQLAILTDLLDANSVRLNVELQLVNARTRVIYTYYQLQKACGDL